MEFPFDDKYDEVIIPNKFLEKLKYSVSMRMILEVSVDTYLSSGVDSGHYSLCIRNGRR